LDALYVGIKTKYVNYVLDADISGFFDGISHKWLVKFIKHRIADKRVVHLIQKWLNAGVIENGKWKSNEEGTPQGGSASPLLANIFLHYALDLWVQQWRNRHARGDVIVVRWADDFVVGFKWKTEAEQFLKELRERFEKFGLKLNPDKTKLIEFGAFAKANRQKRQEGKPETFQFLGFTHVCGTTSAGRFTVIRITSKKKMSVKLKELKIELGKRMHEPVPTVGKWLRSVIVGHNRYYGVPMNLRALRSFRFQVGRYWCQALKRRSQNHKITWERMTKLIRHWLPTATVCHPYPLKRMGVI
jgi:group II intron reverse transcriptase/maturase